jgi:hypothetical protein
MAFACHASLDPAAVSGASVEPQFNRHIRPILAENCLACHGHDVSSRKGKLRLDTREGLFEATADHAPAVAPGSLERSPLWKRITTPDPDDVMPPPDSRKSLTSEQKEQIKDWILAGAQWQGHWAFIKPDRPELPKPKQAAWARNPIDAFVLARLEARGLAPNPEADRRTLARRWSLDVTGLPPEPEAVERFAKDRSRDAEARFLRLLMGSPHWGEQRARYWLDAARYADTHGLHFDNYREMWPYRDYVIRAFNHNLPFDRFIVEQLAGDLLDNPTDDQLVATGFQRCNMTTNEGGTIEEENLANYANDRVTTTGWVFLGLTANCGACHDHKFDPFTMRDFYSLAAFFRNTAQSGFDRNWREGDLFMIVPQTEPDRTRWKALPGEIAMARKSLEHAALVADAAFTNWLSSAPSLSHRSEPPMLEPDLHLPLTRPRGTITQPPSGPSRSPKPEATDGFATQSESNPPPRRAARARPNPPAPIHLRGRVGEHRLRVPLPNALEWREDGPCGPAPVFTKERSLELGNHGDFDSTQPFSIAAWVRVPDDYKGQGSIVARMAGEADKFRGWDFYVKDDHFGVLLVHRWQSVTLRVRAKDRAITRGAWHHLALAYDGSTRAEGIKLYLDGTEQPGNKDADGLEGSIHADVPLRVGRRQEKNELEGVAVQDLRLYRRRLGRSEIAALAAVPRAAELLPQVDLASTNNPPRELLKAYHRVAHDRAWRKAARHLDALEAEQQAIRGRSPVTHIQRERTNAEPVAQVLFRGQYDKPKEQVRATTPAALHALPDHAPRNRLGLAQWLVSPDNPLTARVLVNRFWQEIFGVGLVRTTEDFGSMGEPPVNPDLLDWLTVEFQQSGWDVQQLFQLILTSAAYRQSAAIAPDKLERDPQNRLLSRGPRFRMDAEMLRDYALASSGLLVRRIGGPSAKPYQPDGVWEAVAMPESNTRYYQPDTGDGLYRRSLYTFWKRAAPPATMDILNAPSRETCTVRRERTNTPLQALATLNDPQFVEAARALATRALRQARGRAGKAIDLMAERVLLRSLTAPERRVIGQTYASATAWYAAHPADAARLLNVGASKPAHEFPAADLGALTLLANQLLNLDEALNK